MWSKDQQKCLTTSCATTTLILADWHYSIVRSSAETGVAGSVNTRLLN